MTGPHLEPALLRSASVASPRVPRSRTQSISSDRPSTIGHGLASPPLSVSPEAAFIASSAASQIVTNDHDSHANSWYDESGMLPADETAMVTPRALQLVNNFLDQLLFNFLQLSKATTLASLRPAVSEVLKPKLAKDAINNADEELREYLGGGDEEDFVQPRGGNPGRDWDLELVWKRTRLRCMVYSSLGDMEEEEEDTYMEQEHLEIGADEQISDVISPAVAIFLTSVLEFMGELTLTVAGQAAYHRMRATFEKELKEGTRNADDILERVVVTEADMERVALDRTLGRLWRGWKKRIRAPSMIEFGGRSFSRSSVGHMRMGSNVTDAHINPKPPGSDAGSSEARQELEEPLASEAGDKARKPDADDAVPAEIPLPIGENDVDEIEVPGLAYHSDEEEEDDEDDFPTQRPWSFLHPSTLLNLETPEPAASQLARRQRSFSLPSHGSSRFIVLGSQAADVPGATDIPGTDEEKETPEEATSEQPGEDSSKAEKAESVQEDLKKRRISTAFGAAPTPETEPIGVAKTTDEKSPESNLEDVDADAYEKAEIVTSARVSMASSAPSGSEGDARRTSSISSARIVDVAGPKGSGSRSPSIDTTERPQRRSASLSRASHSSSPSVTEGSRKPRAVDNVVRATPPTSLRSSPDGLRPPRQNASTISESEEESDHSSVNRGKAFETAVGSAGIVSTGAVGENIHRGKARPSSALQPSLKLSTSRQPQVAPNTKVTIINKSNSAGPFIDEPIPEVPFRAPARQSSKPDAASGQVAGPRDSEDTGLYPIQSNTSQRRTNTSGSSSSSAAARFKATRTSEEHVPSHADNVARNFEELIHSNQTITYTLTPENMRDMDSPRSVDSPVMGRFSRTKGDDYKSGDRSRSSSTATDAKGTSSSRMAAVGSHSPTESKGNRPSPIAVPGPSSMSVSKSTGLRSSPKGPGSMSPAAPKSHRAPPSNMAREARVPADSTADFAEFIKSTGPPGEIRAPPIRNANNTASSAKTGLDSHRVSQTAANRNRYQPREAAVDAKDDNSDLIDFIRQGPPGSGTNHRIPRHVAPFRNTMDSDHMASASGGRAVDATIPEVHSSRTSTNMTESSMPSTVNSQSALLRQKPQPAKDNMFDDGGMMPQRKQRRVRDPYAIDFSDEEDDDLLMTPQPPPKKKEESLAEFLRNYEPPPEPQEVPISQKIPKKKLSAPSLMGRFARAGFGRDQKEAKEANGANGKTVPESRSLNSRTGTAHSSGARSGHVPLQVNMPGGYDKYGALDNSAGRTRVGSSAPPGRVPMKKFEPRDATPTIGRTGTADLAAFLRDSGPPPGVTGPPVRGPTTDEGSGLSKMWARRKNIL